MKLVLLYLWDRFKAVLLVLFALPKFIFWHLCLELPVAAVIYDFHKWKGNAPERFRELIGTPTDYSKHWAHVVIKDEEDTKEFRVSGLFIVPVLTWFMFWWAPWAPNLSHQIQYNATKAGQEIAAKAIAKQKENP